MTYRVGSREELDPNLRTASRQPGGSIDGLSNGTRLTVDAGAQRIDVGKSASEVEREWLYEVLAKRYSLPSEPVSEAAGPAPARSSDA